MMIALIVVSVLALAEGYVIYTLWAKVPHEFLSAMREQQDAELLSQASFTQNATLALGVACRVCQTGVGRYCVVGGEKMHAARFIDARLQYKKR